MGWRRGVRCEVGAFLAVLEADIRQGSHVGSLSDDLAQAMLANLDQSVERSCPVIQGETSIARVKRWDRRSADFEKVARQA